MFLFWISCCFDSSASFECRSCPPGLGPFPWPRTRDFVVFFFGRLTKCLPAPARVACSGGRPAGIVAQAFAPLRHFSFFAPGRGLAPLRRPSWPVDHPGPSTPWPIDRHAPSTILASASIRPAPPAAVCDASPQGPSWGAVVVSGRGWPSSPRPASVRCQPAPMPSRTDAMLNARETHIGNRSIHLHPSQEPASWVPGGPQFLFSLPPPPPLLRPPGTRAGFRLL